MGDQEPIPKSELHPGQDANLMQDYHRDEQSFVNSLPITSLMS